MDIPLYVCLDLEKDGREIWMFHRPGLLTGYGELYKPSL